MIWSSHSQYGLYHQSSRFRPQTPQDALIAQRLEEAADEIQTQYWKSLYPEKIKKIQQEIEHTCDELDYAGSFIYDEYPDKINLNRTGRQICERLRKNEEFREIPIEDLFEASGHDAFMPPPPPPFGPPPPPFGPPQGPPPPRPPRQQSWLEDIVSVLLYQEIARRRCQTMQRTILMLTAVQKKTCDFTRLQVK